MMQGQQRTRIIQHPALLGVEITMDKTARFLDGTDPTYRRSLSCTKGSDSHRPEELGSRVSYLKLGAPTLAAVRQCLHDPDPAAAHTALGGGPSTAATHRGQRWVLRRDGA